MIQKQMQSNANKLRHFKE